MNELLTAAQMRAIEAAAIDAGETTGLAMMERAGQAVMAAIEAWADGGAAPVPLRGTPPEYFGQNDKRAVVLCGPGNNGGDGFVVARLLAEAGWSVEVFLFGDTAKLVGDAQANFQKWSVIGEVKPWSACTSERWAKQPLVVDALFGTGLTRALPPEIENVLMATVNCPRVAVDMPSGLCADRGILLSGKALPPAHLTVTFHRAKLGHVLGAGAQQTGALSIGDIGLGARGIAPFSADEVVHDVVPVDCRKGQGHKYSHGHALVLSGGVGTGGAARLAARGALRIGAGAVTLGCPPAALIENAGQLNAVMLQPIGDAGVLETLLLDARINVLCLGPGLGLKEERAELVASALDSGRALVLDADALTLIARDAALFAKLHDKCVLTPHAGEFARLFPEIASKLEAPATSDPAYSKVDAARAAATRAGCVVLFKGPDTVIADPSGRLSVNPSVYERACPWLATAGSGDVLAGFITGLLARGYTPMQAAETGAWLHTECARSFGPGLIAEDLPEELPKVLRNLGL